MPIDASIPLGTQTPNPMQTVSSMLGVSNQQQQLQAAQMENQQKQIDLQETRNARGLMNNIKHYQDSDGNIDLTKLAPDMAQAAPKNYATFMSRLAQAQTAATQAKATWNQASDEQRNSLGSLASSLVDQDPDVAVKTWDAISKSPAFSNMSPALSHITDQVHAAAQTGNKSQMNDVLQRIAAMSRTPETQQAMRTPGGVSVDNGQQFGTVSTRPGTTVPPGEMIPGTAGQHQLPPGTPTIGPDGQPQYLGAQGGGGPAVFDLSGDRVRDLGMLNSIANDPKQLPEIRAQARAQMQQTQGRVPAGMAPGQAQNIVNNVDEMSRHFSTLQDQSTGNQLQQGLIGNIKSLAHGAATGTGAGRKAFVDGLLAAMHIPGTGDEAKDTDLLEKNMAQLGLATPASSDAMRAIVTAARPHGTMQEGALLEAADQLSGQIQANVATRNALSSYKMMGDVQGYNAARQKLESIADPRAFQFASADDEGRRKLLANLTPSDRQQLRSKIDQLEQMGLIK